MATALLVVDVQYDFLPGGSLAVNGGDEILPPIRDMLSKGKWDYVAASQDYHPQGHVSFASTYSREPFTKYMTPYPYAKEGEPNVIEQVLWPDHCVQGARGSLIEESISRALDTWIQRNKGAIIQKGTAQDLEAYSAFSCTPPAEARLSSLSQLLKEKSIGTIYIVGLAADYCVRSTALSAQDAGFDVVVVKEAIKAVGGEEAQRSVEEELKGAGVKVLSVSHEEVQAWF